MDSKFLRNWVFWFYSKEEFCKERLQKSIAVLLLLVKTAFSLFSLLFNVKSGLILMQNLFLYIIQGTFLDKSSCSVVKPKYFYHFRFH